MGKQMSVSYTDFISFDHMLINRITEDSRIPFLAFKELQYQIF